ncbi:MAG: CHRD domain-containing protein [Ignavibacteria bacterium]
MKTLHKILFSFLLILTVILFIQQKSSATVYTIAVPLEGNQEVPPNPSTGLGAINGTYDDVTRILSFSLIFNGLAAPTTAAHFHAPAPRGVNAVVVIGLGGFPMGVTAGSYSNSYVLTVAQNTEILNGLWYVNIHTSTFPGGEIRGQLDLGPASFNQSLILGNQEVPPNSSTGFGQITWNFNSATNVLSFYLTFTGLAAPTTAAHFHAPASPGVNAPIVIGFAGFPTGVSVGYYSNSYVVSEAQELEIVSGLWYVNIHTAVFPGGEIRGQLTEGTLPVELSSFTANLSGNNVTLKWSTAHESNNSGFDVERKLSSSNQWVKAGNVSGNGNSNIVNNYSYSEKLNTGIYNYRLKQIDYNGNFEYFNLSNEVNIDVPASYNISQNYPNPFNPSTKIDYELPHEGRVNIILYDISGKEVSSLVNEVKTAGYYTVQLNSGNLSSGTYFYKFSADGENKNFTITKMLTVIK